MIVVQLNGEEKSFHHSLTLSALLLEIGLGFQSLAIAVNSEIIPRSEFENIAIKNSDRIEIIRPVGGG